jgi:hypothetical protein
MKRAKRSYYYFFNYLQWVQIIAMTGSNTLPTQIPELRKAEGIAKMPVPMLPLSKWAIVSKFLPDNVIYR